jgi:hypothetical protein
MNGSAAMTTSMTTPAFTHLISINTNPAKGSHPMTATTLSVEYHQNELRQVATDLRNERMLGVAKPDQTGRSVRVVIGEALVSFGTALAGPRRTSIQPR